MASCQISDQVQRGLGFLMDTDDMTKAIDNKIMEYALMENVKGVSQEALFCLKKVADDAWGQWKDYDGYIPLLKKQELKQGQGSRLGLDVFFAETDNSSGVRGSR
ncbi:hypothetical protein C7999DRAFT_33026 [Corynascus novoguineensis]|uniref:Uncharacterized protein n=1 Tax=Corynascus novoguineensis TaxID=1126955 RepID=A0AAN7CQS8_9PEZI|nr:hypothetical protein C7999DRAFT_33026 [Corynascus novoguineensis]